MKSLLPETFHPPQVKTESESEECPHVECQGTFCSMVRCLNRSIDTKYDETSHSSKSIKIQGAPEAHYHSVANHPRLMKNSAA